MTKILFLNLCLFSTVLYSQFTYLANQNQFCEPVFDGKIKFRCTPFIKTKTILEIDRDQTLLTIKDGGKLKAYKLKYFSYDEHNKIFSGKYIDNENISNTISITYNEIWIFNKKGKHIYKIESATLKK